MGSALYFILLFSGLWTPAMCVTRQFYVVEEQKNWTEAQKHCRGIYTDLATIENQEDMDTVVALVNGTNVNYWIGMNQTTGQNNNNNMRDRSNSTYACQGKEESRNHNMRDGSNCTYSCWGKEESRNHSWVWSDGSNFTYSCWGDKEPNNAGTNNCVQLYKNYTYKWNDAGCSYPGPFICYKKINLILVQQQMTWREALMFCRENNMDLVSVNTNETQDWVATVTKHANTSNVWMGLRHTCTLGLWYWVSGESVCYQNWAPGNGTGVEDCSSGERSGAVQSGSKKWISLPETQELNFICTI